MRSSYRLSEQLVGEIKGYLGSQQQGKIKTFLETGKSQLRSVLATDMNCHPKLLFMYNEFLKLKESIEQHTYRKDQFLLPFLRELVYGGEPGHLANAVVVNSFLSVFGSENDKITGIVRSLDEASGNYKTDENAPAGLKSAFNTLKELSDILGSTIEKENAIFHSIKKSHKEQFNSQQKRA